MGGQNLDPIPVELTYGVERILMAQQGVTHFKDITYSRKANGDVVTYGEAFGQQEYEMSRYYLDDADVEANRRLYETYVGEATRMVEATGPKTSSVLMRASGRVSAIRVGWTYQPGLSRLRRSPPVTTRPPPSLAMSM